MEEFEGKNVEFVLFYIIIKLSVIVKPPNPLFQMPRPQATVWVQMPNPRDVPYRKMPRGGPGGEMGTLGFDWCIINLFV